jgi:hypothetical protein
MTPRQLAAASNGKLSSAAGGKDAMARKAFMPAALL